MEIFRKVEKKEVNWIMIFIFPWDIDETNVDEIFEHIHKDLWNFKEKKVIFNFIWVKYLNSKSLWYISQVCSIVDEEWWKMYISNCYDEVKEILNLVWIDYILPIVKTEEEAINLLSI